MSKYSISVKAIFSQPDGEFKEQIFHKVRKVTHLHRTFSAIYFDNELPYVIVMPGEILKVELARDKDLILNIEPKPHFE